MHEEFSEFGKRFAGRIGIAELMDDLERLFPLTLRR